MRNVVLDLTMGVLCLALSMTIVGLIVVPLVLEAWEDMRD